MGNISLGPSKFSTGKIFWDLRFADFEQESETGDYPGWYRKGGGNMY